MNEIISNYMLWLQDIIHAFLCASDSLGRINAIEVIDSGASQHSYGVRQILFDYGSKYLR